MESGEVGRVYHGLPETCSVSKMGHVSLGPVLDFGTPQHTMYLCHGVTGICRQGSTWVYCGFGVFLNRSFFRPLFCNQNEPLVMPNGQILTKLWSKEIWKKFLLNVACNTHISPTTTTTTTGKNLLVKHKQNLMR